MTGAKIALVVERDFASLHIGVKRVIRTLWDSLSESGFIVELVTPISPSRFVKADHFQALRMIYSQGAASHLRELAPVWTSSSGMIEGGRFRSVDVSTPPVWSSSEVELSSFDASIMTAPWLAAKVDSSVKYTLGVVYDAAPNLLAMGQLRWPGMHIPVEFAREHLEGFEKYLTSAKRIMAISTSAAAEFMKLMAGSANVEVFPVIPFVAKVASDTQDRDSGRRIVAVNILDPRKNFVGAAQTLRLLADQSLDVDIIATERMPQHIVMDFLGELAESCRSVRWFRSISDSYRDKLLAISNLSFFPSFYEGLGLPVLESQSVGTPCVSSGAASLQEVNLNPNLCVSPHDSEEMASKITDVLSGSEDTLSRNELIEQMQLKYSSEKLNNAISSLLL